MLMINKIAILIPAYNEKKTISKVINSAKKFGVPLVVDDGSTDSTYKKAKISNVIIVRHPHNRGYEESLYSGLNEAKKRKFKYVIVMDADGQHNAKFLKKYILEFSRGAELVLGYRENYQRPAEIIFSIAGKFLWGIKDPLCGMKGYKVSTLTKILLKKQTNSIGTELCIRLIKLGANFSQIPIKIIPREDCSRFGNGFILNLKMILNLLILIKKYY
jgi:glycosyltransferase involved in cell wall biosynthesis